MYNGIGLQTARGSGTNGYVQTNKAFIRNRKERVDYKTEADFKKDTLKDREPNLEILEHERKRKLEVKCMELRELMESQSFSSEQIEKKVSAFREKLLEKDLREHPKYEVDEEGRPIASGTHQNAAANLDRNQKLRNAFGISSDYVDGSSLDPLRKQKELEKRMEQKKYKILKEPGEERLAIQPKHGKLLQITEKGESVKRRDGVESGKRDRKNLTDDDKTVRKPGRRDRETEKAVRKEKNDYRGHGAESSTKRTADKAEKPPDRRKGSPPPDRNRKRRRSSSADSSSSSHSDAGRQKSSNRYPGKESSSDSDSSSDVPKEVPGRSVSGSPVRPSVRARSPAKDGSPNPSPWKPERVKVEARSLSPRRYNSNYRRGSPRRVRPVSPMSHRPLESRRKSRTPGRRERQRSATPERRQRTRSRTPERRRHSGRDHSRSRSRSRDYRRERSRSGGDRRRRSSS